MDRSGIVWCQLNFVLEWRALRFGETLVEVSLLAASPSDRWRVLGQPEVPHISLDAFGVVDRGADFHVGSALRTGADVDPEDAL